MNLDKYPIKPDGLYWLRRADFDEIGEGLLSQKCPEVLEYPQRVDIEHLAKEELFLEILYDSITPDGKVLGMIAFSDLQFETLDHWGI